MTPEVIRIAVAVAVAAVGLVVAIDAGMPAGPTIEAVVLVAATVVGLRATSRLPDRGPERRPAHRSGSSRDVPDELAQARDRLTVGLATAEGRHFRLGPWLRRLATHRCERHAVDLADEAAATQLLGPELYDLVRPDRGRPRDRDAPGVDLQTVRAAVERLERL